MTCTTGVTEGIEIFGGSQGICEVQLDHELVERKENMELWVGGKAPHGSSRPEGQVVCHQTARSAGGMVSLSCQEASEQSCPVGSWLMGLDRSHPDGGCSHRSR